MAVEQLTAVMQTDLKISRAKFGNHTKDIDALFRKALGGGPHDHYIIQTPSVDGIALIFSAGAPTAEKVSSDLGVREVVLSLAGEPEGRLAFSYFEQWKPVSRRHFMFRQACLRFYWLYEDQGPQHMQAFRLEWVAGEKSRGFAADGVEVFEFQGEHAAHPHWHFDRISRNEDRSQLRAELEGANLEERVNLEAIDFGKLDQLTAPAVKRSEGLKWLHKIHFPALADWAQKGPWDTNCVSRPHQRMPEKVRHLEAWVYSATIYIKYEATKHV